MADVNVTTDAADEVDDHTPIEARLRMLATADNWQASIRRLEPSGAGESNTNVSLLGSR